MLLLTDDNASDNFCPLWRLERTFRSKGSAIRPIDLSRHESGTTASGSFRCCHYVLNVGDADMRNFKDAALGSLFARAPQRWRRMCCAGHRVISGECGSY